MLLDEMIQRGGKTGIKEIVIGMAHRGRLNVLVNIMGKMPKELFMEFEGKKAIGNGTGDVKYHMGFSSDIKTPGGAVHLALAFNPSHLEIAGPVVEGSVRARQDRRNDNEGNQSLSSTKSWGCGDCRKGCSDGDIEYVSIKWLFDQGHCTYRY